ncbi:MAG: thymidine kinase [Cyclobacteriaceae bacterium]|nr:thymidine kinase [Cyclobacteriaceae bacterium]
MFVEPTARRFGNEPGSGWIEVICGSMFSGKTEELIRRLNRAIIAQQRVEIFKPIIDRRYSKKKIVSHNESAIHSTPVHFAHDILINAGSCDVIGIDEVQFFDEQIVEVANQLANQGKRVIAAGLDMDFLGRPFTPMDRLMSVAEYVTKVHAICMECGNIASYSHRRTKSSKKVVLGEKDIYEALCRKCFYEKIRSF